MHTIGAFFVGLVVAILSSFPVGPVNFAIVQTTLNKGRRAGLIVGLGGVSVEMIFCFIALFGYHLIDENETVLQTLNLITIPVLMVLGVLSILRARTADDPDIETKDSNSFFLGFTLAFSNPLLFGYWVYVTTWLQSEGWLGHKLGDYIGFTLGVTTGICVAFFLIVHLVSLSKARISPRLKYYFNVILGSAFIAFAIWLGVRYLTNAA